MGPLCTLFLSPYTPLFANREIRLASSFLFNGWISFHSPKSIATAKAAFGTFNATCRCASRKAAQLLSTGSGCVCMKLANCTMKKGNSLSASFSRQSIIMAASNSSYSLGRPVFVSPWYHNAPVKVRLRRGEIMELYMPVGTFWKETLLVRAGISQPNWYFQRLDKRTVSIPHARQ